MTAPRVSGKRPTRADVARQAQVSTAVVSYTMNGGPKNVAPETRERVLLAARALGYTPNAAARALKRGTADMLGLIVMDNRNPFFAELTHAIELEARRAGYSLLISNFDESFAELASLIAGVTARQVDGVIIAAPLGPEEIAEVWAIDTPVVLLNQFAPLKGFRTIGSEFYEGAVSAVEHLISHDLTKIAFVGGENPEDSRRRGWADALADAGLRRGEEFNVPFSREGGHSAGVALAALETAPDAVFVSSDQQAIGLLSAVQSRGMRVPDDLAVVSFDGSAEGAYSRPTLTTVSQSVQDMAKSAIASILEASSPIGDSRFPTEIIIRESCGCPPVARAAEV